MSSDLGIVGALVPEELHEPNHSDGEEGAQGEEVDQANHADVHHNLVTGKQFNRNCQAGNRLRNGFYLLLNSVAIENY